MLILYTTEDGKSQIKLRADQKTVWLTQNEMAELFGASKQNISLQLKNLFEDEGLQEKSVVKESLTTDLHEALAATVKEFVTVQIAREGSPTAEESSVVRIAPGLASVTEKSSATGCVRSRVFKTHRHSPSFPRRRESRSARSILTRDWIPAFAGMTDCRGLVGRWMRPAPA